VVHVSTDDPAFLDLDDDPGLLSNLVWAGGGRLVRDVWVAGERVLEAGEPTRVDRAAVQADARTVAARLRRP
jgi:5-methylthioadenosine/S-adenosylhomocysteine deaminase